MPEFQENTYKQLNEIKQCKNTKEEFNKNTEIMKTVNLEF
jgi:hypothetical protein